MANEHNLDEQLAAFTDALLAGNDPALPPEMEAEARVIRLLQKTIAPEQELSAEKKMTARVMEEYTRQLAKPSRAPIPISRRLRPRQIQALAAAAAVMLVAVAVVLSLLGDPSSGTSQTGTAAGGEGLVIAVFLGLVAVGGGLFFLWRSRR